MAAKDLGNKHVCFKCSTKFYDLKKPAPICPKCGADQREMPAPKPNERKRAAPKPEPEEVDEAEESEDEEEEDEDEDEA